MFLLAALILMQSDYHDFAKTPPMGWNSWDSFGTTITEEQAKAQADAMAEKLKPFGWKYFTVDIQWYEPNSKGHDYKEGAKLEMDEFSRLLPAKNKFPSSANGAGFKPLADYVHKKGLKFGIHIMRGISRQAVNLNTPIKGTTVRAADIADKNSTCAWNPDMYGVDMRKTGAQAYYDSIFQLYASWGVDLVKVDDIARPYDSVQKAEIEAIRKAIDKTGRKIVLSLSPGDTPVEQGAHVSEHANMWRISDDFWDVWEPLHGMFGRLDMWTPYRKSGAWPDADMLPFGVVDFGRKTRFTNDEAKLCMTLWCIAKSPLILGSELTKLDDFTLSLLTNKAVIEVNQKGTNPRQLFSKDDQICWVSDAPKGGKYVALFNTGNLGLPYDLSRALFRSPVLRDSEHCEVNVSIRGAKKLALYVSDGGDHWFYDNVGWIEPTLHGPKGDLKLTDLNWKKATCGWGAVRKDRTAGDRPLTSEGREVGGIGTHATSLIEFDLPLGYETFTAKGAFVEGSEGKGSVEFMVLTDQASIELKSSSVVSVSLEKIGFKSIVRVRDLWNQKELGKFKSHFEELIPVHGAGLYWIRP